MVTRHNDESVEEVFAADDRSYRSYSQACYELVGAVASRDILCRDQYDRVVRFRKNSRRGRRSYRGQA